MAATIPALRVTVRPLGTLGTQLSTGDDASAAGKDTRGSRLSDGGNGTGALVAFFACGDAGRGNVRRGSDFGIVNRSTSSTAGSAVPQRRHMAHSMSVG
jgi:hypothetical protein